MELKQEPLECYQGDTDIIKQESAFDASLLDIKKEIVDLPENLLSSPHCMLKNEEGFQKEPTYTFLKSEDCHITYEVKSNCSLITTDLKVIKQDITQSEYNVPKVELLTSYSDLPSLKSEESCSSGHYQDSKQSHDASNKKIRRYPFPVCQKSFPIPEKGLLKKHFWKLWLACDFCGHFYIDKFEYFTHHFNHTVKMNTGHLMAFKTKKTLKNYKHCAKNSQKSYICNKKTKQIEKKSLLIKRSMPHTEQKLFNCDKYQKQCLRKPNLIKQLKTQTGKKQFKCEICLKHFTQKKSLKDHLKIHTGEKPFKCKICLKQFKQNSHLKGHLKIHTGQKPNKCEICFKGFLRKSDLDKHLKIHTGEKPFKCKICLKQFKQNSHLKGHLKIHTGQKPNKCEICFKGFLRKSDLDKHLKIHTGEKPFKCEICLKQFTRKSCLNEHLKNHTGEKPFKCELC